jgi:protein-disulfide isomerase
METDNLQCPHCTYRIDVADPDWVDDQEQYRGTLRLTHLADHAMAYACGLSLDDDIADASHHYRL